MKKVPHTIFSPTLFASWEKLRRRWCAVLLLLPHLLVSAQTYTAGREEYLTWEDFVENYCERETGDVSDDGKNDGYLQQLQELHARPYNINTVSREALLGIPFLSEEQADSILSYRRQKRFFRTLGELQFVSPLTREERQWLSLFIYAGDTLSVPQSFGRRIFGGRHDLTADLLIPCYRREGNQPHSREELEKYPNRQYLGNGLAHTLRYRYRSREGDVAYGLTMQKDAGEPFGRYGNLPYDYTSGYFHLAPFQKRWALWLGDYEINVAQGLLVGSRRFGYRQILSAAVMRPPAVVRPHTSTDEAFFLRGAAMRWCLNGWQVVAFASWRRIDGTLRGDTLTALKTDGLHRTEGEMERRRVAGLLTLGAQASYVRPNWHTGATVLYSRYGKTLYPPLRPDNRHVLRGRSAAGVSLHYAWRLSPQVEATGEVAADRYGHLSLLHVERFVPSHAVNLTLQGRHLSPRYVAPHAGADVQNSRMQNETGLYGQFSWQMTPRLNVTAHADLFRFKHPVFRASLPRSKGMEAGLRGQYSLSSATSLSLRYKMKSRQQDVTGYAGRLMQFVTTHRLRFGTTTKAFPYLTLHAAADAAVACTQTTRAEAGWMLSTRAAYARRRFSMAAFMAAFFTESYAARLYAYQPQLPYVGGFPSFYHHGLSFVCQASYRLTRNWRFSLRNGFLHYFNRSQIGTGTQAIGSPTKNDVALQMTGCF